MIDFIHFSVGCFAAVRHSIKIDNLARDLTSCRLLQIYLLLYAFSVSDEILYFIFRNLILFY